MMNVKYKIHFFSDNLLNCFKYFVTLHKLLTMSLAVTTSSSAPAAGLWWVQTE